jgi:glycosyltransferase involved in cell wall biosynthesis
VPGEASLVLHVIPTPVGRGAQRAARSLVDSLDGHNGVSHRLISLFDGPSDVPVDGGLRHPGTAEGFNLTMLVRVRKLISDLGPSVVVAHGGEPMKYLVPALVGSRCRLVYCVIGTFAGNATRANLEKWKQIMRRSALVVAVGDEVLDECVSRFGTDPTRAVLIPNGRDPSVFHPQPRSSVRPERATVIFVGALTVQKRPDLFIEIARLLKAEGRGVRALMVGDGPLRSSLGPLAQGGGVELLGARQDVPDLLRDADVLVFPSSPAGEGMPGILIEAGLSGLPVVSAPVPGARSVIESGRTGEVVPAEAHAMATAVGELLDDPERRSAMGSAARARCQLEYSLDVMASRWSDALQPLIEAEGATDPLWTTLAGAAERAASALVRRIRSLRGSSHSKRGG